MTSRLTTGRRTVIARTPAGSTIESIGILGDRADRRDRRLAERSGT